MALHLVDVGRQRRHVVSSELLARPFRRLGKSGGRLPGRSESGCRAVGREGLSGSARPGPVERSGRNPTIEPADATRRLKSNRKRAPAVSAIYFTLAGIVLYLAADWVLERIEVRRGERLEHRTLVFFGILLGLALATFPLLQSLLE